MPIFVHSQVMIKGKVLSALDNKEVEYANIVLMNKDSSVVRSQTTNANGKFEITASSGNYIVNISAIGFGSWKQDVEVKKVSIDLGAILLKTSSIDLAEVMIYSKKPLIERKVDRIVFNTENNVTAIGGTALDALSVSPGVRVNNDNINIIGRDEVQIMVNGNLIHLSENDLVNYLKSIRYDNIAKIEIISNPPSQYEAQGNSGLINIILKSSNEKDFSGTLSSSYSQTSYGFGDIDGNINYKKRNITISSNLRLGGGATGPKLKSKVFYPTEIWESESERKNFTRPFSGRVGIGYNISKKSSVGLDYLGGLNKWNIDDNQNTTIRNIMSHKIDSILETNSNYKSNNYFHSVSGSYQLKLDTLGKKITFVSDYFIYNNQQDRVFSTKTHLENGNTRENSYYSLNNNSNQNIKVITSKIDLEFPFSFGLLEFGGKISFIKNQSDVDSYILTSGTPVFDATQSNIFNYEEKTQAVYSSFIRQLGSKLEAKVGLRIENTRTEGTSKTLKQVTENNYTQLFPTAYITYRPSEFNVFSITYGRRIGRPSYENLNPFVYYSNPYAYTKGNPLLRPSFTQNIELSHTYKSSLISTLSFSSVNNGYGQITFLQPDTNIQATFVENYYKSHHIGLSESYVFNIFKDWESYNQLAIYYNESKGSVYYARPEVSGFSAYLSSSNSIPLNKNKTIFANLNFWYQFPETFRLSKNNGYSQLDAGLRFDILDNKLQAVVNCTDVFATSRPTSINNNNNVQQIYENYFDIRSLRFSLTYKFGNKKIKSNQLEGSNLEERSRTN